MTGQIKHNKEIFTYFIGGHNILIKLPDNSSEVVNKYKIKGQAKPNLFRKLISFNKRFEIKHWEIEKYIKENY